MTEAESIAAFQGYLSEINSILFGYIGLLSGFLIMSYLVADKLSKFLSAIVLALFTTASTVVILRLFFTRNDFTSLYQYILQQTRSGNFDLPWFGTNPAWGPQIITYMEIATTVGGFLGCIAFFLFQRRRPNVDSE
jgi:hypothetical protein